MPPRTKGVSSVAGWHQHSRSMQGMELAQFCSTSRVVIVAGKGGVGKTTVTAALAVAAARTGMSVLIVEVEGKSGLASAFDRPALTYDEAHLDDGSAKETVKLEDPTRALYMAPWVWHELTDFAPESAILVVASTLFDEADYLRDYETFKRELPQREISK